MTRDQRYRGRLLRLGASLAVAEGPRPTLRCARPTHSRCTRAATAVHSARGQIQTPRHRRSTLALGQTRWRDDEQRRLRRRHRPLAQASTLAVAVPCLPRAICIIPMTLRRRTRSSISSGIPSTRTHRWWHPQPLGLRRVAHDEEVATLPLPESSQVYRLAAQPRGRSLSAGEARSRSRCRALRIPRQLATRLQAQGTQHPSLQSKIGRHPPVLRSQLACARSRACSQETRTRSRCSLRPRRRSKSRATSRVTRTMTRPAVARGILARQTRHPRLRPHLRRRPHPHRRSTSHRLS